MIKYKHKNSEKMMKIAKIILIALVIIGITALVFLSVRDKFNKNSSDYLTGKVTFPITGFAGENGFYCACSDDPDSGVETCAETYPNEAEYCDSNSGKCVECIEDSQCESGKVCDENVCETGCTPYSRCGYDEYCDFTNSYPGTCMPYCGNGVCDNRETEETCSQDCAPADNCYEDPCCESGYTDPIACGWSAPSCDIYTDPSCPGYIGYPGCNECWCDSTYCTNADWCNLGYEEYC
jgi:hypothetical protein